MGSRLIVLQAAAVLSLFAAAPHLSAQAPPASNAPALVPGTPPANSTPPPSVPGGVQPGVQSPGQSSGTDTSPTQPPAGVPVSPAAPGTPVSVPAPTPDGNAPIPSLPPYGGHPAAAPPVMPQAPAPRQSSDPKSYSSMPPYIPYGIPDEDKKKDHYGSTYIPVDSWVYPAMTRLYSLGFADTEFLNMRPWTRRSVLHILDESEEAIRDGDSDEARGIFVAVKHELREEETDGIQPRGLIYGVHSYYTRVLGISGPILRDSYHLGQTIVNDYGRPYEPGFNLLLGASTVNEYGPFSLYVRGEYQHAPSATGYSQALSQQLSLNDSIPYSGAGLHQATIPTGPIGAANPFRLVEATLSAHFIGHEFSVGKSDAWQGPGQGGAMGWSNNAEDIYSVRINRVDPLYIPYFSRVFGTLRYDFFYGSLKGHTQPNHPYVHSEQFSLAPTKNFQFGFERTVIFGGRGHEPVTLHTFLRSFFSISDTTFAEKNSARDPGARFTSFTFSYRLPFIRKYATLYADSESHDDVTPPSAPRRAGFRTGLYLSQIPAARKLDLRVEAILTDPSVSPSVNGKFQYYEGIQQQGYTNKGFIFGDWIGREAKGGQAWVTYHLSGNEWVQLEYLNKKTPHDFIPGMLDPVTGLSGPGGTTQNSFKAEVEKRFLHDNVELNAWFQYERWKAPIYRAGQQSDASTAVQVTFYPGLRTRSPK